MLAHGRRPVAEQEAVVQMLPRGRIVRGIAFALALTAVVGCRSELQFSPTTLADAQVGSPYATTIIVSQAATPVDSASIQDGALPAGLDLTLAADHSNRLQISGTPTVAGTFSFTIYVSCVGTQFNGQTATQAYTLVVK